MIELIAKTSDVPRKLNKMIIFFFNNYQRKPKIPYLGNGFARANKLLLLILILCNWELVDSFICSSCATHIFNKLCTSSFRSGTSNPFWAKSRDNEENFKDTIIPSKKDKSRYENEGTVQNVSNGKHKTIPTISRQPNRKRMKSLREVSKSKNSRISYERESLSLKSENKTSVKTSDSTQNGKDFSNLILQKPEREQVSRLNSRKKSHGLSSFEDFLGVGKQNFDRQHSTSPVSPTQNILKSPRNSKKSVRHGNKSKKSSKKEDLPSIADLFPPDLYNTPMANIKTTEKSKKISPASPSVPILEGVLPISDLFYRSSQSMNEDENIGGDDLELPFSAEQSDKLTTEHNKIKIRRNQFKPSPIVSHPGGKQRKSRKMVRRGIEMLVGGVPINADPPQRYIDLLFNNEAASWSEAITINSRDFGPMYHSPSVGLMSKTEEALFCEHFVHSTSKWGICPQDLGTIVSRYVSSLKDFSPHSKKIANEEALENETVHSAQDNNVNITECILAFEQGQDSNEDIMAGSNLKTNRTELPNIGFGIFQSFNCAASENNQSNSKSLLSGELVFSIGASREDLETEDKRPQTSSTSALERVLARGITAVTECTRFNISFEKLLMSTDMDDGTTLISGKFEMTLKEKELMNDIEIKQEVRRINLSLAEAIDDGDMQLAMAAAAKEETAWPEGIRDRVVEEFLFDNDDGDGPLEEDEKDISQVICETETDLSEKKETEKQNYVKSEDEKGNKNEYDTGSGALGGKTKNKDDIFLGGGTGVFWNYSEQGIADAPYQGKLGLRLVDETIQRAKQRYPRVIAIGDVHGCIDELQDLLRKCDYRPGDLIVFLGDLVSKGPDSISVVQMAREIGAIGVRGNHDFEVIRWHQAIKAGVDPPVVGSEHFHIASGLTNADMKWMYSLPWFISSKELGTLFVHAGFVSGIRLAKQNPRLMMNMRSILPDGTVTSKFFNNWPWARLWDGPQTVLFGHDADRGLQQYEHAIGLDTGCVYGGRLTACILPERRLVSVSARREYFKYRRKHYT